jgi:hypothetical protein
MSAPFKNDFSWSASRADTFDYCLRKYYFSYYESWEGWERNAPERKKKAYFLKKRKTVDTWIGDVLHRAIRYSIENKGSLDTKFVSEN